MKPIIGITSFFEKESSGKLSAVSYDYVKAIKAAEGIPIVIPIITEEELLDGYISIIDGLLLSGGEDLSPLLYGENPIDKVNSTCCDRDKWEMALFEKAYKKQIPILGICRGMQLINVALGGTLYQDINKQVENSLGHCPKESIADQPYHRVKIDEGSKLYNIFGKKDIEVNSFHHQSLKDIGKGLKATAYSHDGIVEGVESLERDLLMGVQWHPEKLTERYPIFLNIFKAFIKTCKAEG